MNDNHIIYLYEHKASLIIVYQKGSDQVNKISLNKYKIELNNRKPTIGISFILLLNHIWLYSYKKTKFLSSNIMM